MDATLRRDFAIARPRLVVTGLNPHAGEDGTLGDEEITIIAPAIAAFANAGSPSRARYLPIPCSMETPARALTRPFVCTTIRL